MRIEGTTTGLKPGQVRAVERLLRRRIPANEVVGRDLAAELLDRSIEIGRRIGCLIDRGGNVQHVVVGDAIGLTLPDLGRVRSGFLRFRGLRLVHTHLRPEPLGRADLVQLTHHRLDLTAAIWRSPTGGGRLVEVAHLVPPRAGEPDPFARIGPMPVERLDLDPLRLLRELESEFSRTVRAREVGTTDRAILVHVVRRGAESSAETEASVAELRELARTAGVEVIDVLVQVRERIDPRTLLGKGRLEDLNVRTMQLNADLIIFDHEITPAQARAIGEATDRRVIDRTQLILDIFAQHAESHDGRLQVELARLQYLLPHLAKRDDALSRLTGGIGGRRGPGETKLEESRRRVRERVTRLERQVRELAGRRRQRRSLRARSGIPVVAIVGYTNVGKSTLLNTLTRAGVPAENKLFATLDPRSRRLRLPGGLDVVLTDTVGFIRRLPAQLVDAFRATLEELRDADLLVHLCDASDGRAAIQVRTVDALLAEMDLGAVPRLLVVNKVDRAAPEAVGRLCDELDAIPCSAVDPAAARRVVVEIERRLATLPPTAPEPPD